MPWLTRRSAISLSLCCLSISCQTAPFEVVKANRVMMDTVVSIHLFLPPGRSRSAAQDALEAVWRRIAALDSLFSNYREDNEVAMLNRLAHTVPVMVSARMYAVLRKAVEVDSLSKGAFDISVGGLTAAWGFGRQPAVPPDEVLQKAREGVGRGMVQFNTVDSTLVLPHAATRIDLGGIAKGAIIDVACRMLQEAGFRDYLVDAGGDLRMQSSRLTAGQRHIWITHPRRDGFFARFRQDTGAVATTGDYERYFEQNGKKYHHVINPFTGYPARKAISATVLAQDAMTADALATALFILGPREGIALAERLPGLEAVILAEKKGRLVYSVSSGLADRLEIVDGEAQPRLRASLSSQK